ILLTHLSHRTGLVLPVREIAALARSRGIDVIVDAAHSWQQLDFTLPDLDCDFVGLTGHKWLGAPLGVGMIHVRSAALAKIDRDPAEEPGGADSLRCRVHTGTLDYAAQLTVPAALAFQRAIGRPRRAARLRWLRDRWVGAARRIDGVDVLTPDDPALHGGITSFRLRGVVDTQGNRAVAARLLDRHRIFTVHRDGAAKGACVRVTPALFTRASDVDALAAALTDIVGWAGSRRARSCWGTATGAWARRVRTGAAGMPRPIRGQNQGCSISARDGPARPTRKSPTSSSSPSSPGRWSESASGPA
ncbi:aminotransferase class V-fold PLP-dependent enzyme, partial [Sphingomonas sp. DT-51]|uniref:aminotransferase class V-fold PLP-dependent enzyme n=1 Tax=Sphingomonas sp. DT-51 TaxID=3396165 RepID=UPI003F193B6E